MQVQRSAKNSNACLNKLDLNSQNQSEFQCKSRSGVSDILAFINVIDLFWT